MKGSVNSQSYVHQPDLITPQIRPHLERGALMLGTIAAFYAIWLGVGLSGALPGVPGLGSSERQSPLVTELYAHGSIDSLLPPPSASTAPRGHLRAGSSSAHHRLGPPAAVAPVVVAPPTTVPDGPTTSSGPTSPPASDPTTSRDRGAPAGALSTPVDSPDTPPEVTASLEDGLNTAVADIRSTVSNVQAAAATAAVPAVSDIVGALPTLTVPSLLPTPAAGPGPPILHRP